MKNLTAEYKIVVPERVLNLQVNKIRDKSLELRHNRSAGLNGSMYDVRYLHKTLGRWVNFNYIYSVFSAVIEGKIKPHQVNGLIEDLIFALQIVWENSQGGPAPFLPQ